MNNALKLTVATLALFAPSVGFAAVSVVPAIDPPTVERFTFQSSTDNVNVSGRLTVDASGEVIAISGAVNNSVLGHDITGIVSNSNFPGNSYSPDGLFLYNNTLFNTPQRLDINGLLFTTSGNNGGYWNLWGTGPNSYTLYASNNGGYPVQEVGTFSTAPVPELSTWALMLAGFAALGFVGKKRRTIA